jgi:hypothetical protein
VWAWSQYLSGRLSMLAYSSGGEEGAGGWCASSATVRIRTRLRGTRGALLCSALLLAPVIEASIGGTVTGAPCSPPLPPLPPSGSNVTGLGTSTQPRCTRVRWSTHRLPARSIWFRPMEHTPCSYSSILVEFISRYFKYSLYVF